MKTKLVLIGAFGLSVIAAILLIASKGGSASEQPNGVYQPVLTSNGEMTFQAPERAKMTVVMDGSRASTSGVPRTSR